VKPLDHAHPVESLRPDQLAKLQSDLLRVQVAYLHLRSPFYRAKLTEAGIGPDDIRGVSDLTKLPFTFKDEIRRSLEARHPLGDHLAADPAELVQFHASSGTTGRPSYVALTRADLADWTEIIRRSFWTVGFRPGDRVLQAFGMSRCWVGGLPLVQGLEALGASQIPAGAEPGARWLLNLIVDLEPNALAGTPGFVTYLGEQSEEVLGRPARDLAIRKIYVGGEPGGGIPSFRSHAEDLWGAEIREVMGGTDLCPVLWAECEDRTGMHFIAADSVAVEIVSLEDQSPLPIETGTVGELVYTHLKRQATPVVRFRHADIVEVTGTVCACGRTSPKVRCFGRTDDMIIVRGINVYPSAIQDIVASMRPDTTGAVKVVKESALHSTSKPLRIRVERGHLVRPADEPLLARRVEGAVYDVFRVRTQVEIVPPDTFPKPGREKVSLVEKSYEIPGGSG
jgi:phenylacetate-CoA ligase